MRPRKNRILLCGIAVGMAGATASAQVNSNWLPTPVNNRYHHAGNWGLGLIASGTAVFDNTTISDIEIDQSHSLRTANFMWDAPEYRLRVTNAATLTFTGAGVLNESQVTHRLEANSGCDIIFTNNSSAGDALIAYQANLSEVRFQDFASAGNATILVGGSSECCSAGALFEDNSTAGNATIGPALGGGAVFIGNSTAGNATLRTDSSYNGFIFLENATMGSASLYMVGDGSLFLAEQATGGDAHIVTSGYPSFFDRPLIELQGAPTLGHANVYARSTTLRMLALAGQAPSAETATITSLPPECDPPCEIVEPEWLKLSVLNLESADEGSYTFRFGSVTGSVGAWIRNHTLEIGHLNEHNEIEGAITPAMPGDPAVGGTLAKVGAGRLTLLAENTYTVATNVNAGELYVNGSIASAANRVFDGATLGGDGAIYGSVSVRQGGRLAAGAAPQQVGSLHIQDQSEIRNGGKVQITLQDAALDSIAGAGVGWDVVTLASSLNFTSTPGVVIELFTLDANGQPGLLANFDPNDAYSWMIFDGSAATIGNQYPNFSPGAFAFDLAGVANIIDGEFSIRRDDRRLFIDYTPNATLLLGDMNCDGLLTVSDIGGFVLALTDPAGYAVQYPNCDLMAADINDDGLVSVGDIGGFVGLLTQ